jgi:hypothetical protein
MKRPMLFAAVLLGLAACDPGPENAASPPADAPAPGAPGAPAATPSAPPLTATGPAAPLALSTAPDDQTAAAVVSLDQLTRQGQATVKLFGTAGGDPAMNGLYTHIAFYLSPAEGWAVYRIGDFLGYEVLSESPGRVDLKVEESVMDEATGRITSRERRLIIGWTPGAADAPPAAVTVAPAR